MESDAFARAWRYLKYKILAKWAAIVAAVMTGVLYVAFLVLLLLFADLLVNRGKIPSFQELNPTEQNDFLLSRKILPSDEFYSKIWSTLKIEEKKERLQAIGGVDEAKAIDLAGRDPDLISDYRDKDLLYQSYWEPIQKEKIEEFKEVGVDEKNAIRLSEVNPNNLTPGGEEVLWRSHLYTLLKGRVGPEAAQVVTIHNEPLLDDLEDRGILSLVVRTRNQPVSGRLTGALARYSPWMWQRTAPGNPNFYRYLTGLLSIALLVGLLRSIAMFLMNYLAAVAVIEACNRLRRAVYHHTFRLGTLFFRSQGQGEAVSIFTRQMESVHDGLYTWLTVVYREPVKFALLLIFALILNFWLALVFLFFAILVWLIGDQIVKFFRNEEKVANHKAAEQLALLQESIMMMRMVKTYLMEGFNQARVERQLARHSEAQLRRYQGEAVCRPLLILIGTLAGLVLLYVAGRAILSGNLRVASGITLAIALASLYWPLVNMIEHRRFLRRGREAALAVFKFLDRPGEVGQAIGAEFLGPLARRLEFDKVTLREPGTGRKLLENVSLNIKAGQRVGLVGPDDQEKYALIYLLPRFLDPSSGEIRFDGKNLRWVTFDSLRTQIAMVLQQNLIFNDTIVNNIGCGDPGFTLPKIIEAAKVAHAHHFIQKLPTGYETIIGEMGHSLSVSEQFRIGLARAILRDPALLVIEEPVVPLDEDSKALVDDTFSRVLPGRTVIFLPHRMSTIRSCDQVFLLHKGQIEAEGDHRELLSSNQLYRHLQYIEFNEFAEQTQ